MASGFSGVVQIMVRTSGNCKKNKSWKKNLKYSLKSNDLQSVLWALQRHWLCFTNTSIIKWQFIIKSKVSISWPRKSIVHYQICQDFKKSKM